MAETNGPVDADAAATAGVMRRRVSLLLRLALGAIFLYAGVVKAAGPQRFALDIESYQLIPPPVSLAVAYYLPFLEIVCALGLCLRAAAPGAALLVGGLMSAFTFALATAWARGLEIRCGCFGGDSTAAGAGHGGSAYFWWLARDAALLAGSVVLWMLLRAEQAAPVASRGDQRVKIEINDPTSAA